MHDLPHRRPARALTACAIAAAVLAAGCSSKQSTGSEKPAPAPAPAVETPAPVKTEPEQATVRRQPDLPGAVAIMVENHPDARPQAGLNQADIVYEMEAEGGITRFLALFYSHKAANVGPVRSARMGFIDVATAYGVPYAHCGGSDEALYWLKFDNTRMLNLDEINTCGDCFWRISERQAPHNLYTSTDRVVDEAQAEQFPLKPLTYFPTGDPPAGGKPAATFAANWGQGTQTIRWTAKDGRYVRFQSGAPHVVADGSQVAADNVVVLFTRYVWDAKAEPTSGLNHIAVIGQGTGYLFRGGQVYPINWAKAAREAHFSLTLADGSPVHLNEGQTWVEVLKSKDHLVINDTP